MANTEIKNSMSTDSKEFMLPRGKIIKQPDFKSQDKQDQQEADDILGQLDISSNSEKLNPLPEYITKSNGYKALNVFKKQGIIKEFDIDFSKSGDKIFIALIVTSNEGDKYTQDAGGVLDDLQQASSSFENMVGDLVITGILGLEGGYLPADRNNIGFRKYVIFDKKDPNIYIAQINVQIFPGETANKAALAEILKPDSQIVNYLKKRGL